MNKGRRKELLDNHYKRRLRNYRISDDTKGNFHAFKTTGKPCSGICCQQPENNYHRSKHKINEKELMQEWDSRYDEDFKQEDIIHESMYE